MKLDAVVAWGTVSGNRFWFNSGQGIPKLRCGINKMLFPSVTLVLTAGIARKRLSDDLRL